MNILARSPTIKAIVSSWDSGIFWRLWAEGSRAEWMARRALAEGT